MIDEIDAVLDDVGFDPDETVLTHRQAQILALREAGRTQAAIAQALGTSRANVSSIEASARQNLEKARETVTLVEAIQAPVTVTIAAGTDLYEVPERVYAAADEASVKVDHDAPELMRLVSEAAGDGVDGREVRSDLHVSVSREGTVRVRLRSPEA